MQYGHQVLQLIIMRTDADIKNDNPGLSSGGIFQIRNTINDKIFIGSCTDFTSNWEMQKQQLEIDMHPNHSLQKEWDEFGPESFLYEILERYSGFANSNAENILHQLEEKYIHELHPFGEKGYH